MRKLEVREIDFPKLARDHQESQRLQAVIDIYVVIQKYRDHDVHALHIPNLRIYPRISHQTLEKCAFILLVLKRFRKRLCTFEIFNNLILYSFWHRVVLKLIW